MLQNSLAALNDQLEQLDLLRAWFYAALLQLGGHGLNLDTQVSGAAFSEDELYRFDFETMAFFAHDAGTFSPKHIKLLRLFTKTSTPTNLLHVGDAKILAASLHPLLDQCLKLSR